MQSDPSLPAINNVYIIKWIMWFCKSIPIIIDLGVWASMWACIACVHVCLRVHTCVHMCTVSTFVCAHVSTLKARFMGPTWGPAEADRTQLGPMLDPWTCYLGICAFISEWGVCAYVCVHMSNVYVRLHIRMYVCGVYVASLSKLMENRHS